MPRPATIQLPGRPLAVRVAPDGTAPPQSAGAEQPAAPAAEEAHRQLAAERAELAQARQALQEGLERLDTLRAELVRQAEQQLVDLALDIARKVLMQEIQAGRYEIDPIVTEALRHVPARQVVVAHLHPDDWARCQRASDGSGDGAGTVRFVADASVPRAACVLETPQGVVQSVVEDHLERIAEDLGGEE